MSADELYFKREGAGAPVVLLHPVGLDHTCWDQVAAPLSKSFDVIRPDLPGHGRSPAAREGMLLSDYAAGVSAFMDRLGQRSAAVVGLSFGGMIAQTLGIEHPSRCESLVVAGCPCTFPAKDRPLVKQRGERAAASGMASIVEETLERWFTPDYIQSGQADPVRRKLVAMSVDGWRIAWGAISEIDTVPRLGSIKAPTLCVAGELDKGARVDFLEQIAARIPGAHFALLRNAPHMMQFENAAAFAGLVADFLRSRPEPR